MHHIPKDVVKELHRRSNVIWSILVDRVLAPEGNKLSCNELMTLVSVLLQHPSIILVYKNTNNQWKLVNHLNFEKLKISRGSLELKSLNAEKSINPTELTESSNIFKIFNTNYGLRVFVLDTSGNDRPFYEVNKRISEKKPETRLTWTITLSLELLKHLFELNTINSQKSGRIFIDAINADLTKILDEFSAEYISSSQNKSGEIFMPTSRRAVTKLPALEEQTVKRLIRRKRIEMTQAGHQLDRIYTKASFAAKILNSMGIASSDTKEYGEYPNIFFTLRTYDRLSARCGMGPIEPLFDGYMHNVALAIPETQKRDIGNYLLWMRKKGRLGYKNMSGFKMELFGDPSWEYKNDHFKKFAETVDIEFWKILTSGSERSAISKLIRILQTPTGSESISIFDVIFYYRASIYRMPFRRNGGMEMLWGLERLYQSLSESEKHSFSFHTLELNRRNNKEIIFDILRVVVLFYVTRFLGPVCSDLCNSYTKLHIYPIEVDGSIVGSIGKVSFSNGERVGYDQRAISSISVYDLIDADRGLNLKTSEENTPSWDQEVLFFRSVVLTVQDSIRQQYKDMQVDEICKCVYTELLILIRMATSGQVKIGYLLNDFINKINSFSVNLCRICPYPAYVFSIGDSPTDPNNSLAVKIIDGFWLTFIQDKNIGAFRAFSKYGSKYSENQQSVSLKLKLEETVRACLESIELIPTNTLIKIKGLAYSSNT